MGPLPVFPATGRGPMRHLVAALPRCEVGSAIGPQLFLAHSPTGMPFAKPQPMALERHLTHPVDEGN